MANTIDQAFIKQFETEVHLAYQRMGSKLRNTVRSSNVTGSVARFQKIGKGAANTKARNGDVTAMELAHTNVEATMADFYAPEYIDKLDELKVNINERQAVAQSAAAALGRKTDEILITALDAGANATDALTEAKLLELGEDCFNNGSDPSVLMIKPADAQIVAGFAASSGRNREFAQGKSLVNVIDLYVEAASVH